MSPLVVSFCFLKNAGHFLKVFTVFVYDCVGQYIVSSVDRKT